MSVNKTLVTALLCLTTATAAAAGPITLSPEQRAAFGIEVAPAAAVETTRSRAYPGEVAVPNDHLRVVSAPQGGLVARLDASEGQAVHAGDPLLRIESPQLLEMQRAFLEARSKLTLARRNLERDRQLFEEGIIAERRLLEARARHEELSAAVDRHRATLRLAGMGEDALKRLERARRLTSGLDVTAPIDGVVLEQRVTAGQRVGAADPLYRIGRLDPLWLEVHVPVDRIGDTAPGDAVVVEGSGIRGTLVTVGQQVHGQDQGVLVRAEVHGAAGTLRPGQFIEVRLLQAAGASRLEVPRSAVVRDGGRTVVFAETDAGFRAVPVEVVSEGDDRLVVTGGLGDGDRVAVAGTAALKSVWLGGGE